jgi:hypothetical protein
MRGESRGAEAPLLHRISLVIPALWTLDVSKAVTVGDRIEITETSGPPENRPNTQVKELGLRVMGGHGRVVVVRPAPRREDQTGRAPTS